MEPRIEFARTSDGVNIAYWRMGEGVPLIAMPSMPWSHLEMEWGIPEVAYWHGRLAENRMLVRYDGRGFGLSQRDVEDLGLDAQIHDLEAVVDRIGTDEFDVYAGLHSGAVAVAYAAQNPGRIKHLVLFCSYADGIRYSSSSLTLASRPIIEKDWDFYSEVVARLLLGWEEAEPARLFAELVRECTSPAIAARALGATASIDVTDLLARVDATSLVMHRRDLGIATIEHAQTLAAGIPGARMAILEGSSVAPYLGEVDAVLGEIGGFLADTKPSPSRPREPASSLRTVLFTDVEGSTDLTQRLGDDAARHALRDHERLVREQLDTHAGTEIKTMGDGFMASFGSAVSAIRCAMDLQQALESYNDSADEPLLVRVGMSAGEPIEEGDDLHGTTVISAARIGSHAGGGEILVSDVVRQLVAGKSFEFEDLGEVELRGFATPTRVHKVLWRGG